MNVRYLLFDLDGTLIDSYQALTTALNQTGRQLLDHPLTEEEVKGLVGEGVERLLLKAFGRGVDAALIEKFEEEYARVCCAESRILDEVEETLAELEAAGFVMGVCTNKPTSFSRSILEHLGIARHFRAVVGPELAGSRKPDPGHVLFTLDLLGGTPRESWFIGDMPIDVLAARAAEIPVAAIATGSASREELLAARPDILLQRFSDLVSHLQSQQGASV